MAQPATIAARFLSTRLRPAGTVAATLSAAGVAGVWSDRVNSRATWGTPQQPRYHIVYAEQIPGNDLYAVGARRLLTDPLYQVTVVGRVEDFGLLDPAATALDALLHATEGPVAGGYVDSCVREGPLKLGPLMGPGDITTYKLGGLYRISVREE